MNLMDVLTTVSTTVLKTLKNINKEMVVIFIWFLIVFSFLLNGKYEKIFSEEYFLYIFLGLPILFVLFRIMNSYNEKKTWFETLLEDPKMLIIKVIGLILFIVFFSWTINSKNTGEVMVFVNIFFFAIVILGVLTFLRIFKSIVHSWEGWTGIIGRVVFFIPCMISDFFFYLMEQFTKSPFVVYVLIAIEILLILMYKFLPDLFKKIQQRDVTELQKNPVLIQNEKILVNYNKKVSKKISSFTSNDLMSSNTKINPTDKTFALSLWFYVVGMSTNKYPYNEEANIFKICDNAKSNYHPKIVYDGSKNMCKVYCSAVDVAEFKITLQKWVHFAISYNMNNIDIFVNGELVKTVPRAKNSVVFTPTDNAVVGQKDGLFGGVCNVVYFEKPLTKQEIKFNYELNKGLDPPTN